MVVYLVWVFVFCGIVGCLAMCVGGFCGFGGFGFVVVVGCCCVIVFVCLGTWFVAYCCVIGGLLLVFGRGGGYL